MINYDTDEYGDDVVFSSHTSIIDKELIDLKFGLKFSSYKIFDPEDKKYKSG